MVKVKDKAMLTWALRLFDQGKAAQKWLCTYIGIKPRRFRQIYSIYKQTKTVPPIGLNVGRPAEKTPSEWTKIVEDVYGKQRINAVYPEKAILEEWKVRIPHDTIHEIMLEKGFAREQKQ
jgi:hypothetical protein